MGKVQRDGTVCECFECCFEEEIPPTLRSPDSEQVMQERAEEGQRQDMLDNIMALAKGEKQ